MQHGQHQCNPSETQVQQECSTKGTSATSVKNFDFDNDTSKNIFSHLYINYMANKDYNERNNFILRTTLGNASFPCQNAFEKCTIKTELFNGKRYIKKLYTIVAAR